jgi:RNA polymerase sigma-70 factor, ECF subfamily
VEASPTLVRERPVSVLTDSPVDGAALLYERYYDRVVGYCLYQLGSREEAEDVAQTTFMWAFRGLRRGVVPRAEASWLFTIAQNTCRAHHRSRGRKRTREVLSDPVQLADMSPAHAADTDDLMGLEDALARMPDQQRRALLLREWRGLSYKEIAAEMDLSNAAVETLIFRARRSLAALLSGRPPLLSGPPAPKRARRFAFDFGSIGVAIKALLGSGGVAGKVAAGLATAVLATTVAGSTEQTPPGPVPLAPTAVGFRVAETPAAGEAIAAHEKPKPKRKATNVSAPVTPTPPPTQPPTNTSGPAATVPDMVEKPLSTLTQTVDETVTTVEQAVAPVTETLPVTVQLPW